MQINTQLARQIIGKAHSILDRQIMIADMSGQILAGGSAVERFSAEALRSAQTGKQVTEEIHGTAIKWSPFVYEDHTVGVFGIVLDNGPITPEAIMLLQGLAEVIVYQHTLLDRLQSSEIMRAEFVKSMLTAPTVEANDIYPQADILQLNLRLPQAIILFRVHGLEKRVNEQFTNISSEEQRLEIANVVDLVTFGVRQGFKSSLENLVAYLGEDLFVLIKGIGGEGQTTLNTIRFLTEKGDQLMAILQEMKLGHALTIGIGQYYPDLGGLRKSYQDAKLALEVGGKVWGRGRAFHIKQVGMFITLANTTQDRKAELAQQILHPLLRDEQLYKTVQAFLACGLNLTDAAEKLHIHRNTLIYRLDKTKKLIALDPRHFDDALQIKLGLMFYQPA